MARDRKAPKIQINSKPLRPKKDSRGGGYLPPERQGRSTTTCGQCGGSGDVEIAQLEQDGDGMFDGNNVAACEICGGTGKIGR
jgi:DnaJ-class molecular chaperone